jgi:hypothetical protein
MTNGVDYSNLWFTAFLAGPTLELVVLCLARAMLRVVDRMHGSCACGVLPWRVAFYAGHYKSYEEVEYQGGTGQKISHIVNQINNFISTNSELVILHISRDFNVDKYYTPFSVDDWNMLFTLLDGLSHLYSADSGRTDLTTIPLNTFIGGRQAAVIIRFASIDGPDDIDLGNRAGKGFFYSTLFPGLYDVDANTDDPDQLMQDQFGRMKERRSSPDNPVFSLDWALTAPDVNDYEVEDLRWWADICMTPRLGPCIIPQISKTVYPNIISVDGVLTTDVVATATAINTLASGVS